MDKDFSNIFKYVGQNKIELHELTKLFDLGSKIAKTNKNKAILYFIILSEIPNIKSKHRDLAIEACLIIQKIDREELRSLDDIMQRL